MRTNDRRPRWERLVLLLGHLAIVAGLALSASTPRKLAPVPAMSILDSFNPDQLTK